LLDIIIFITNLIFDDILLLNMIYSFLNRIIDS